MRPSHWFNLLRILSLLCLGVSVALLLDYVSPDPAFCGLDSGCAKVRSSGFGYIPFPGGGLLPVPVLGVSAFAALFLASMNRDAQARRRLVEPLAWMIAAGALGFIGLQIYMQHFCWMCLSVDTGALLIALCAFQLRGRGWELAQLEQDARTTLMDPIELLSEGQRVRGVWREDSQIYEAPNSLVKPWPDDPFRLHHWAWWLFSALAVIAPLLFPRLVASTSEVPASIRTLYSADEVTVLEFFDFQCPHCRRLSPELKKIVTGREGVGLRLGYVPLPGHPLAKDAARLAICAGEQGMEEEVSTQLFSDPDLTPEHILEAAKTVVPSAEKLDECLASERPDQRIADDTEAIKAAGFEGLPTTYIGETRILGARDAMAYEAAIEQAQSGSGSGGLSGWMYWAAVLLIVVGIVLAARVPQPDRTSIPPG